MENIVKEILRKENIEFKYIVKSSVGFTSSVYFIDENYVLKLANNTEAINKIDKEINVYSALASDFIPKLVTSGDFGEYKYIIITKLKGKSLFSVWHYLTKERREDCVKQISDILKFIHSKDRKIINEKFISNDFLLSLKNGLLNRLNNSAGDFGCESLIEFLNVKFDEIFSFKCDKLIYNDAHFDNFLYNEGKVYLIDFDRVEFAPVDYELMIFKTMCDYPTKFASEEVEKLIYDEDFSDIYLNMKSFYSELFEIPHIEERVAIYQFDYLFEQAIESKNGKWAKSLIFNLKKFFNIE